MSENKLHEKPFCSVIVFVMFIIFWGFGSAGVLCSLYIDDAKRLINLPFNCILSLVQVQNPPK